MKVAVMRYETGLEVLTYSVYEKEPETACIADLRFVTEDQAVKVFEALTAA